MKKILTTAISYFILHTVSAQTNLGIKAGYNYSTARVIANGVKQKTQYISGYGAAIMFKTWFDGVLHFSPYIAYNRRGYSYSPDTGAIKQIENTIHYIDVVPILSFDFPINPSQSFIAGFGPVMGFAISGKEKITPVNGLTSEKKMVFSFADYGRYDVGLTANIGYRFNKYLLEVSYLYSLTDLENNEAIKRDIRNRMFNMSVGYYFK
jgi:Outer membrane protein beta-barrel domain